MKNLGFDISYVLFGETEQTYSHEEELLIIKYRQATTDVKDKILAALFRLESETTGDVVKNHKNSVKGQQIGDNNQQHNHFASQQNSSINIENQHGGSIVGIKNK